MNASDVLLRAADLIAQQGWNPGIGRGEYGEVSIDEAIALSDGDYLILTPAKTEALRRVQGAKPSTQEEAISLLRHLAK